MRGFENLSATLAPLLPQAATFSPNERFLCCNFPPIFLLKKKTDSMTLTSTFRSIAAGTAAIALATLGWNLLSSSDTSAYAPRATEKAGEPNGAQEIRRMMLGDENGQINSQGLAALRKKVVKKAQRQGSQKAAGLSWHELGPDNIGGRTRAIEPFSTGSSMNGLYAGSVSGGLWKSTNRGDNWTQITTFPNLMVASIALAGNGDLYVGTGTAWEGGSGEGDSGFRGEGIYRSTDSGASWELVPGSGNFDATDALEPDPNNDNRVWFASTSGYGSITDGALVEVPGGTNAPSVASDVAIAPDGSYCLVAGVNGRVYRSVNGDFSDLLLISQGNGSTGNPPQSGIGRARVDIALTANENGTYNAFAVYATSGGFFYGLFFSGDAGVADSWENVWPGEIETATPLPRNQGKYDLAVGISKSDPTLAFVGGIELWRSGPNQQAEPAAAPFDAPGFAYGVHADIHEVLFLEDGTMYIAGDGGIYRSDNNGGSYTACNRNYNVTQFYGMAHGAGSGVLGGTQDNGSLFIPGDGYFLSDEMAVEVNGGDGFDCAVSQVTEANGYSYAWTAASQYGGFVRGTLGQGEINNSGAILDGNFDDFYFDSDGDGLANDLGQFYSCSRLYENFNDSLGSQTVILVNTFGQDTAGGTFMLETASQNLPFSYTMDEDETLQFFDTIVRPDRQFPEPLTEDPEYFWLDVQEEEELVVCEQFSDSVGVDSIQFLTEIVIVDSLYTDLGDTTILTVVEVPTGMYDTTYVVETVFDNYEVCDTVYHYAADSLFNIPERIRVHDPYATMFAIGLRDYDNQDLGIWITRDVLNFNTTPSWIRVADAPAGFSGTKAIEFVEQGEGAGDVMFFTGWNGQVTRVSGLRDVYSQEDVDNGALEVVDILNPAGTAVTGLSVDPNNPNHVVISLGGYGASNLGKVRETFNAMAEDVAWTNIWDSEFTSLPCYDVVVDATDASGATVVVGTEYGIFVTENGGDDWAISNMGMSTGDEVLTAPVFDLKQQFRASNDWSNVTNGGAIYAGTHGRGIFVSGIASDVEEEEPQVEMASWNVFPNPVVGGTLQLPTAGWEGQSQVEVFDLTGRRWLTESLNASGVEQLGLNVQALPSGYYVVRMSQTGKARAAKFVVRH